MDAPGRQLMSVLNRQSHFQWSKFQLRLVFDWQQKNELWRSTMIRVVALAFALIVVAVGASHAQTPAPTKNACSDDQAKLCVGVKPGGGRMIACMVPQRDKLSPGCVQLLISMGKLK
jgi:hypothetical protein